MRSSRSSTARNLCIRLYGRGGRRRELRIESWRWDLLTYQVPSGRRGENWSGSIHLGIQQLLPTNIGSWRLLCIYVSIWVWKFACLLSPWSDLLLLCVPFSKHPCPPQPPPTNDGAVVLVLFLLGSVFSLRSLLLRCPLLPSFPQRPKNLNPNQHPSSSIGLVERW